MLKPCANAAYCAYQARRRRPFRLSPPACRACVHVPVSVSQRTNNYKQQTNQPTTQSHNAALLLDFLEYLPEYVHCTGMFVAARPLSSQSCFGQSIRVHVLARVRYVRSTYMRESFLHVVQVERCLLYTSPSPRDRG